ncbi:hypothetical protein ACVIYL_000114 [Bradyrhizobium sp. USDA 3315]
MSDKKINVPQGGHRVIGDHKGAVLPTKPAKAPMPAVQPTRGSRPEAPAKPSKPK